MKHMSKHHRGNTIASVSEAPASTRTRARYRSGVARPRIPWGRLAAMGALLLIIGGTLIWLGTQNNPTSSTSNGLVGNPAPMAGLQLASSQGHPVSLAQYRGKKVVLFFYEGATCGSCQQQLSLIQGILGKRHDTVAVAASVDPAGTSMGVAQQLKLTYPIIADTGHRLGGAFGDFHVETAGMDMGEVDNHAVYVLDAKGIVRWAKQAASTMWVPESDITSALNNA
jgi:peroxiredoxin Q/BCP